MTPLTSQQRNDLIAIRNTAGSLVKAGVVDAYVICEAVTKLLESTATVKEESICKIDACGDKSWRNEAGDLHRLNDLPAVICANGTKEWWVDGKLHRLNDLPARIWANSMQEWWVNGTLVKFN